MPVFSIRFTFLKENIQKVQLLVKIKADKGVKEPRFERRVFRKQILKMLLLRLFVIHAVPQNAYPDPLDQVNPNLNSTPIFFLFFILRLKNDHNIQGNTTIVLYKMKNKL